MVLTITQETYEDAVRENMELDPSMTLELAITETIEQFQIQGVDLSHIITDSLLPSMSEASALTPTIKKIGDLIKGSSKDVAELINLVKIIRTEVEKGLKYQILAGKEGAYRVLLDVMLQFDSEQALIKECLRTLISLMDKNPDLLDDIGSDLIIKCLDKQKDNDVLMLVLKWTKHCCILSEMNRQRLFNLNILDYLKLLLNKADAAMLRDVLAVLRALVLDDDIRVEFGQAHEHARVIASDTLCTITSLLEKFKKDEGVMSDLMLTLSALLVRTEFCKKVEDAGGIQIVHEALNQFRNSDKIARQSFKVLKALAGNDQCKVHIIQRGIAPDLVTALGIHQKNAQTAGSGLACIAALTLRSPDNSKALFEAGAPDVIVETMKLHSSFENVQKNGSWAIRNMVCRSRYQPPKFLELGAEQVLRLAMKKYKSIEYDCKSALRDLGCAVELKEEWTGKGGLITTQSKK